jgi:hypothetical protein
MIRREYKALLILVGLIAACSTAASAADTITGVVRNQTRAQFAAGDEVVLLRMNRPDLNQVGLNRAHLNQGTQEEARTSSDSQGSFTLRVRYPDAPHLVRVVHQGVNYDQQASAGDPMSIDVFDAADKVQGVTGSIEIIRIGSNGNILHVSDMIEVKNDSNPSLTQSGDRTFEVYVPAHAKIDSVLAANSTAGPGKIAALISAAPVPGEPGHYAVNFPLQPGATKFAFNYDLPYDGHATFRPKSIYPLQQLAVMIPPTMKFTSRSPAFQVLRTGNNRYQVEAANRVKAGEGPAFEISGVGTIPALRAQAQSPPNPPVAAQPIPALSAAAGSRGRAQSANDLDTVAASGIRARSSQLQWWVLGASAVTLGACGFLLWRRQRLSDNERTKAVQKTAHRRQTAASLAEALKKELFQLEIERSLGTISGTEYASAKQALEETVKRALARAGAG